MSVIKINNVLCFRGENTVPLIAGLNVVSGKNSTGKSCFATIVSALVSREENPAKLTSRLKGSYVTDGETEGSASLDDMVRWSPTTGLSFKSGKYEYNHRASVGLVDFIKPMTAKEKARIWEDLLPKTDPKELLEPVWKRPKLQLEAVVKLINSHGWNDALKMYEGQRLEAKKRWQKCTGRARYGKEAAANWVPDDWHADLDGQSEASLQNAVADAQDAFNMAISADAITQKEIDEARKIKDFRIPDIETTIIEKSAEANKLVAKYKDQKKILDEAQAFYDECNVQYKSVVDKITKSKEALKKPQRCPHCGNALFLRNGMIFYDTKLADTDVTKWEKEKKDIAKKGKKSREHLDSITEIIKPLQNKILAYKKSITELEAKKSVLGEVAKNADKEPKAQLSDSELRLLEAKLNEAKKSLACFVKWQEAKKEHENVTELDEVCSVIAKVGVRGDSMVELTKSIKKILANITKITQWKATEMGDDLSLTSDGRPIELCAQNEKLKMQWALQIASARLTKSQWLVLDNCDLLQDESWDGFINLLRRLSQAHPSMHILLCGTNIKGMDKFEGDNIIAITDDHTFSYD